jgi:lipid A 3-O-deacylase
MVSHYPLLLLVAALIDAAPCHAQQLARSVRVTVENDVFDFWLPPDKRPDDNYTHGARIGWDPGGTPARARRLMCRDGSACGASVEIGQEIYTPTKDAELPLRRERSYAGWLYARGDVTAATETSHRALTIIAGVTGPASLAENAQDWFHSTSSRYRTPLGWKYQLPTEPDMAVQFAQSRRTSLPADGLPWLDFVPETHAIVGTLRTAFGAGGRLRLGVDLDHPWLVDKTRRDFSAFVFAGASGEAVARDLFIDGDTFRPSLHRSHKPFVGDWERGVSFRLWRMGADYRIVTLSRNYAAAPIHTYGGLTLTWWTAR